MTQEQLIAIKARMEKATPGPWYVGTMNDALFVINEPPRPAPTDHVNTALTTKVIAKPSEPHQEGWSNEEYAANTDFIAHSRTDIQLLVEEVSGLVDLLDMAHDEFQRIHYVSWNDNPPSLGEIRSLCERGQAKIRQNVPVIVQRDDALKEIEILRASLRVKDELLRRASEELKDDAESDQQPAEHLLNLIAAIGAALSDAGKEAVSEGRE